ncbi:MAG: 16S rRNA (cytosine(1402)-N(4))-methyltransferase RsmH [Gemmatimonadota bacterium]
MGFRHEPVMVDEVLTHLEPERGGWYLDGTTGGGGHAAAILERSELATVVGLDRDPDAINAARERLAGYEGRVRLREADFRDASEILPTLKIEELQGALLDLGVSSYQLDKTARGFSFRPGTPLLMRMGGTTGGRRPAADFLNTAPLEELGRVFREYGEERRWRALAREVARRRVEHPLESSDDFIAAIRAILGPTVRAGDKARLFQAVRIEVNRELEALDVALPRIRDLLADQGRLVVIAYHSLEDRIVKRAFREWSRSCVCPPELPVCLCRGKPLGKTLTGRPVRPSEEEVGRNPRARSAKLRAWERRGDVPSVAAS